MRLLRRAQPRRLHPQQFLSSTSYFLMSEAK
jgi:hypothetical protein